MANLPCEHIAGGGGYADEQERLLTFLLLFLFIIIYSTLTPSSFIPRSLDLHRQVDMQAEEVEEHVGVDLSVGVVGKKNYEEPECGSAANFLLGVEIEGDPPGRMEVEAGGAQCRLTGGNATNSRGGREREVAARQEAKTKVKTEVQMATMTTRLLVARTTSATQINNQPTTGASKCRGPFGEARAEGKRQSHQRLRCLRSRDQHCNKSRRHLSSADDRRWDDGRWCNRRRRRTIDGGAGGQGWEDEDDETG